ncbi:hypothetical protein Hanom_Chr11g00968481 [Helianthus anomalus]
MMQGLNHVRTLKSHEHKVIALVFVEREVPLCISGDNWGEGAGGIFIWGIEDEKPVAALMVCGEDLHTRPIFSNSNRVRNSQRRLYEKPIRKLNEEKDWRYSGIHALAAVVSGSDYFYACIGDKSVKGLVNACK